MHVSIHQGREWELSHRRSGPFLTLFLRSVSVQLAPHYNTVAELRAEYEMSMRKRDQEKLLAMTHPEVGQAWLSFRTFILFSYRR